MEQLAPKAWQYGVLGVVALAFAYAIIHLFRALREQTKSNEEAQAQIAKERSQWAVERATDRDVWARREIEIRFEYEKKHRELIQDYAKQLREDVEQARTEFAEIMATVQASAEKQSNMLVATLEKFYDRFTGSRASQGTTIADLEWCMITAEMAATQRMKAAAKKACEAYERAAAKAEALSEEMSEITAPLGIPTMELADDDSMVIVVEQLISSAKR